MGGEMMVMVEGWWVKKACVGERISFSDHFTKWKLCD